MTAISVVIPSRNEGQRILRTVRSIVSGRSCAFPLEVVVVDDASTDGSCARLADAVGPAPNFRLVVRRLDRWSGIPFARNRGAEVANHPIFVITDANTYYPQGWDLPIRQHYHPSRLLAGTIVDETTGVRGYGLTLELPSMGVRWLPTTLPFGGYVPVAACTCTAIDRRLFHHLGGYDETLPLYGAAEPEFSVRAWLSGYQIVNVPELTVHHRFRPPKDRNNFQESNSSVLLQNYLRFACCYLPEDLLEVAFDYFAGLMRADFDLCMAELERQGIWRRRAYLKTVLTYDFSWFVRRFGLANSKAKPRAAWNAQRNLSVVLLTHDAYFHWLPAALASVYRQRPAIRDVILVIDSAGGDCPDVSWFPDLKVVKAKFASPNDARNAGLAYVETDWACYVDGDNISDHGYFEQMQRLIRITPSDVAILYPDILRRRDDGWSRRSVMPEWDYWVCREQSIIDTCSAWRVSALRQAGGWFTPAACLQDYTTALRLTRLGWKARKAHGITATLRDHSKSTSKRVEGVPDVLWNCRRLAVVTLFAGRRECFAPLMQWYSSEQFPPDTHLVWVDDSADSAFTTQLRTIAYRLQSRFASIHIIQSPHSTKDTSSFQRLHDHVGGLYTQAFAPMLADVYLTVEDDVIAPVGSVRELLSCMKPSSKWGGICAIYPSRYSSDGSHMCASTSEDRWASCPIDGFPAVVVEMGLVAGGFTAWSGGAVHKCLPLRASIGPCCYEFGWDSTLCRKLHRLGYRVGIDGRIRCQHLCRTE